MSDSKSEEQEVAPRATEFAICMGFDAMRICLGLEPENYSYKEVVEWMRSVHLGNRSASVP